ILNPQYRHDIIPGDTHPYSLALPSQQIYSYIMVEDSIMSYRKDIYATRDVVEPGNHASSVTQQMVDPQEAAKSVVKTKQEQRQVAQAKPTVSATPVSNNESVEARYHKVRRGETIESIADEYNMSVAELMALNNLNRKHVSRGQVLKITGERKQQAEQPKTSTSYAVAQAKQSTAAKQAAPKKEASKTTASTSTTTSQRSKSYSVNDEIDGRATASKKQKAETPAPATAKKQKAETAPTTASNSKKQKEAIEEEKATASKRTTRHVAEEESARSKAKAKTNKRSKRDDRDEVKSSKRRKADRDSDRRSKRKAKKEEDARPTSHSVREGESLERIAHRYGLGTDQLRKANPQLKDADMLHPGDKLKVPKANKKKKSAKKEETTSKKKRRR
ncbi:MAG: LysM peptidoglycan-binding domain-containing protein, partial [Bacteroidales bacterium]|nr:LysM peptidoglycan-binding domain-containing protein [Bacteroidales bacterium]